MGTLALTSIIVCDAASAKAILCSKAFAKGEVTSKLAEGVLDHALFLLPTNEMAQTSQVSSTHIFSFPSKTREEGFYPPFLWKYMEINTENPRLQEAKRYVDKVLDDLIEERQEKVVAEHGTTLQANWNMLDRMLFTNTIDDGIKFDRAEILGEILGFFAAGHETTRLLKFTS
jgi:cytochrome P450